MSKKAKARLRDRARTGSVWLRGHVHANFAFLHKGALFHGWKKTEEEDAIKWSGVENGMSCRMTSVWRGMGMNGWRMEEPTA